LDESPNNGIDQKLQAAQKQRESGNAVLLCGVEAGAVDLRGQIGRFAA
jgi:uncharacterized protein YheU (UPF0270 family)